jgi:F-actin capping protein alpha subunit
VPYLDIKALTLSTPSLVNELGLAFEKYNEEQLVTAKLPGGTQQIIISSHSSLGGGRYFDVESSSSFAFDHATQVRRLLPRERVQNSYK